MCSRILFGARDLARGVTALQAGGARVYEVVYEELVTDPEPQLRTLCQFLNVDYDPRMLRLDEADLSILPPGRHHHRVRSGVIQAIKGNRPVETLSWAYQAKIQRYTGWWCEQHPRLALGRARVATRPARPGLAERCVDAAAYFFWRHWDDLKFKLLANLPLAWWRRLRSWRMTCSPGSREKSPADVSGSS
jgi:hypothetical protein